MYTNNPLRFKPRKIIFGKVATLKEKADLISPNSGWNYLKMIDIGNVFSCKLGAGTIIPTCFVFIHDQTVHSIREVESAKVIVDYQDIPKPPEGCGEKVMAEHYEPRMWYFLGASIMEDQIGKPRYLPNPNFKDCPRGRMLIDVDNLPKFPSVIAACNLNLGKEEQ